jgi:hypothetical protein
MESKKPMRSVTVDLQRTVPRTLVAQVTVNSGLERLVMTEMMLVVRIVCSGQMEPFVGHQQDFVTWRKNAMEKVQTVQWMHSERMELHALLIRQRPNVLLDSVQVAICSAKGEAFSNQ